MVARLVRSSLRFAIWKSIQSGKRNYQALVQYLGEVMKQLGRAFLAVAVLFGATTSPVANADVDFIQPTINLSLPEISFGAGINPIGGSYSNDALNIIRAHQVALQQVQAAILYLRANRDNILAGQNAGYNAAFGDFYDPNSQFAGLYNRTLRRPTGGSDRFGNQEYQTVYNTAHFDRVLTVYTRIFAALQSAITYALGAQPVIPTTGSSTVPIDAAFETYRNGVATVGDPLFGTPFVPQPGSGFRFNAPDGKPYINPVTKRPYVDPVTGQVDIDPATGRPFLNPITGKAFPNTGLLGDPSVFNPQITLDAALERGLVQWGDSTSFTPKHLTQLGTDPNNPLRWDEDNDLSSLTSPLTPEEELAFFRDRLDAYAVRRTTITTGSTTTTTPETIYIGGAFLNEEQRSNSTPPGAANSFFHRTELNQYQMIIMALAQSNGSTQTSTTSNNVTRTTGVAIEPGLLELFGRSAYFFEALDSKSYALFANAFRPAQDGGIGDGSLLPPPGKHGSTTRSFTPFVPSS